MQSLLTNPENISPSNLEEITLPNPTDPLYDQSFGPPIPPTIGSYILSDQISQGSFSLIYKATHEYTNVSVSIKIISKLLLKKNINELLLINNEISNLKLLHHRSIVQLLEVHESPYYIYIITNLAKGEELFSIITKYNKLNENDSREIFINLLEGLLYIHSLNICHRDINSDNIIIDLPTKQVTLIDFGYSYHYVDSNTDLVMNIGTPLFACPEIHKGKSYLPESADVWSAGVVLYYMVCGKLPFNVNGDEDTISEEDFIRTQKLIIKGQFTLPDDLSSDLKDLLRHMMDKNPKRRYKFKDVANHPWIKCKNQVKNDSRFYNRLNNADNSCNYFINDQSNISGGVNLFNVKYPIDDRILNVCQQCGYDKSEVSNDLERNLFNNNTAAYKMFTKFIRDNNIRESISDFNSELFRRYLSNKDNWINPNTACLLREEFNKDEMDMGIKLHLEIENFIQEEERALKEIDAIAKEYKDNCGRIMLRKGKLFSRNNNNKPNKCGHITEDKGDYSENENENNSVTDFHCSMFKLKDDDADNNEKKGTTNTQSNFSINSSANNASAAINPNTNYYNYKGKTPIHKHSKAASYKIFQINKTKNGNKHLSHNYLINQLNKFVSNHKTPKASPPETPTQTINTIPSYKSKILPQSTPADHIDQSLTSSSIYHKSLSHRKSIVNKHPFRTSRKHSLDYKENNNKSNSSIRPSDNFKLINNLFKKNTDEISTRNRGRSIYLSNNRKSIFKISSQNQSVISNASSPKSSKKNKFMLRLRKRRNAIINREEFEKNLRIFLQKFKEENKNNYDTNNSANNKNNNSFSSNNSSSIINSSRILTEYKKESSFDNDDEDDEEDEEDEEDEDDDDDLNFNNFVSKVNNQNDANNYNNYYISSEGSKENSFSNRSGNRSIIEKGDEEDNDNDNNDNNDNNNNTNNNNTNNNTNNNNTNNNNTNNNTNNYTNINTNANTNINSYLIIEKEEEEKRRKEEEEKALKDEEERLQKEKQRMEEVNKRIQSNLSRRIKRMKTRFISASELKFNLKEEEDDNKIIESDKENNPIANKNILNKLCEFFPEDFIKKKICQLFKYEDNTGHMNKNKSSTTLKINYTNIVSSNKKKEIDNKISKIELEKTNKLSNKKIEVSNIEETPVQINTNKIDKNDNKIDKDSENKMKELSKIIDNNKKSKQKHAQNKTRNTAITNYIDDLRMQNQGILQDDYTKFSIYMTNNNLQSQSIIINNINNNNDKQKDNNNNDNIKNSNYNKMIHYLYNKKLDSDKKKKEEKEKKSKDLAIKVKNYYIQNIKNKNNNNINQNIKKNKKKKEKEKENKDINHKKTSTEIIDIGLLVKNNDSNNNNNNSINTRQKTRQNSRGQKAIFNQTLKINPTKIDKFYKGEITSDTVSEKSPKTTRTITNKRKQNNSNTNTNLNKTLFSKTRLGSKKKIHKKEIQSRKEIKCKITLNNIVNPIPLTSNNTITNILNKPKKNKKILTINPIDINAHNTFSNFSNLYTTKNKISTKNTKSNMHCNSYRPILVNTPRSQMNLTKNEKIQFNFEKLEMIKNYFKNNNSNRNSNKHGTNSTSNTNNTNQAHSTKHKYLKSFDDLSRTGNNNSYNINYNINSINDMNRTTRLCNYSLDNKARLSRFDSFDLVKYNSKVNNLLMKDHNDFVNDYRIKHDHYHRYHRSLETLRGYSNNNNKRIRINLNKSVDSFSCKNSQKISKKSTESNLNIVKTKTISQISNFNNNVSLNSKPKKVININKIDFSKLNGNNNTTLFNNNTTFINNNTSLNNNCTLINNTTLSNNNNKIPKKTTLMKYPTNKINTIKKKNNFSFFLPLTKNSNRREKRNSIINSFLTTTPKKITSSKPDLDTNINFNNYINDNANTNNTFINNNNTNNNSIINKINNESAFINNEINMNNTNTNINTNLNININSFNQSNNITEKTKKYPIMINLYKKPKKIAHKYHNSYDFFNTNSILADNNKYDTRKTSFTYRDNSHNHNHNHYTNHNTNNSRQNTILDLKHSKLLTDFNLFVYNNKTQDKVNNNKSKGKNNNKLINTMSFNTSLIDLSKNNNAKEISFFNIDGIKNKNALIKNNKNKNTNNNTNKSNYELSDFNIFYQPAQSITNRKVISKNNNNINNNSINNSIYNNMNNTVCNLNFNKTGMNLNGCFTSRNSQLAIKKKMENSKKNTINQIIKPKKHKGIVDVFCISKYNLKHTVNSLANKLKSNNLFYIQNSNFSFRISNKECLFSIEIVEIYKDVYYYLVKFNDDNNNNNSVFKTKSIISKLFI